MEVASLRVGFPGIPLYAAAVDPVAFNLGPLNVHWYGVMMALAFVAGIWTASRRCLLDGIHPEKVLDIGPWLIVGAIIGARTFYVVSYWKEQFAGRPFIEVFMVQHGGLVYYGGLLGALSSGILFARLKQIPVWRLADTLAPSIALGYIFGRMGCLLNGCCYGQPSLLPWAITFPAGHDTHPVDQAGIPVHPTQVYDSLLSLGLYLFLGWLFRRKKFDGQIFASYLICYACTRSLVELFRGDYPQYYAGWITPAHLVSILILTGGLALFFLLPRTSIRSETTKA